MTEMVPVEDEENFETYNKVIQMISFGKGASEIERHTNVPPRIQRQYYDQFMSRANDPYRVEARSKAIVSELDVAYSTLIAKMDRVIEDEEAEGNSKMVVSAIKEQASIIKMRAEVLTKAGVIGAEKIGEDIARYNRDKDTLMRILSEMKTQFPEAVKYMHRRLAEEQESDSQ